MSIINSNLIVQISFVVTYICIISNNPDFRELLFTTNTVVDFSDVEIGREPPSIKTKRKEKAVKSLATNFKTPKKLLNAESCATSPSYKTIPNAIKFEDTNSYTHIKTNFWKTDYTLTFQFRTFYPNGVLFISAVSICHVSIAK